ncbi:FAD dependent oxidoreductase [Lophiotrema nucula]|uniref:FAD dependent oxidoreductase n=1 Tax=Lophiotrema nucula TaxID=690887 RepID=A0A6A5Z087_9PLEO|nr:FAD dependent oxidoreductase [Lophiotrema nucula]
MGALWSSRPPSSILIVGSGVFGLATAYSLSKNDTFANTSITLVDRQPFPAPDSSSIDTSRIVRPDYASKPYANLAATSQNLWRTTFAPEHYHENGLVLSASASSTPYVKASLENVGSLETCRVEELNTEEDIRRVSRIEGKSGETGYVNWSSGWVDAEGAMRWLRLETEKLNRVTFVTASVSKLLIKHATNTVNGVSLQDGGKLEAELVILAAGAWTPSLLDLRGLCKSTGQILVYLPITDAEQTRLQSSPTILNMSTGMFMIPPSRNLLKIARHGHGYTNPTTIPHPESSDPDERITVSLPYTAINDPTQAVPEEGLQTCRSFLSDIHPSLSVPSRPFTKSRICWYTDTPTGDFLISYHPTYKGLFVATGGSGHAFKFLPVIGDKVLECVMGRTPEEFKGKWEWPKERVLEERWEGDGSRGGPVGMVLAEEMARRRSRM